MTGSPGDDLDALDDQTVASRRPHRDGLDTTDRATGVRRTRGPAPEPEPGPRRRGTPEPDSPEQDEAVPDDGSTVVARRESRRRAAHAGDAPETAGDVAGEAADAAPPPEGRIARSPDPARPLYRPRPAEPLISSRRPPAVRPAQEPLSSAELEAARRSRTRRRALLVAIAASVILVAAVAAIVLLVVTG